MPRLEVHTIDRRCWPDTVVIDVLAKLWCYKCEMGCYFRPVGVGKSEARWVVITDNGLSTDIDTVVMPYQLSSYTLPVGIEKGIITVGVLASSLSGNDGNNALMGNDGNNTLNGGEGSDLLFGGLGDDVLNGGMGNDALSGGSGKDTFLFNTAITENVDRIADFKLADNTIKLENLIFAKLTATGVLDVSQFVKGTAALDSNDYVIYNTTKGAVTYDSDGSGADQGVIIAMLGVNLAVTNTDFVVI